MSYKLLKNNQMFDLNNGHKNYYHKFSNGSTKGF